MNNKLKEYLKSEEQKAFAGWDFSYLAGRWESEDLPWDYKEFVLNYLKKDYKLLDMGTGGGEFLLSLNHPYENTYVTESYEPNIQLCNKKLKPLGINVNQINEGDNLPFDDDTFNMVINRHEEFDVSEVKRVLKTGGIFITQQVGEKNNVRLREKLIGDDTIIFPGWNLQNVISTIEKAEFEILYQNEYFPNLKFFDVGAITYFAKIIEWEFPNFSVDKFFEKLQLLNKEIEIKKYVESCEHRFVVVCKK